MYPIVIFASILSFTLSYLLTPLIIKFSASRGFVGVDIHKPKKPKVPTLGGIAITIAIVVSALLLLPLYPIQITTFLLTVMIGALVGLVDDLKQLSGYPKMLITVVASFPLFIAGYLFPSEIKLGRPVVPILGKLRLTIVYWFLLPLAIAVPSNAVNMLEVFNGVMPITCGIASASLLVSSMIINSKIGIALSLILLGSLLGYLPYNKYPAKVFSGNVGSYVVGAAIGSLAIISGLEFELIVVLLPHILNALLVILSVGGIKERRSIRVRPIIIEVNGLLRANNDSRAPLTLTRVILTLSGPLTELEIVNVITVLELWSAMLSLATSLLKVVSI